jgi:dolichol-phosphate mannosyltransferase
MSERIAYSVVLPSYLEEENLRLLLPRIRETLSSLLVATEIVVVDTVEALDATESVCRENGARYVNRRPANTFGDAVRTGIAQARGERIVFMDADGSHAPEFILKLIAESDANEIVIASRYVEGGVTENDKALVLMSRVLNLSYSLFLNLKCKDVSNSFKIYQAGLLKSLELKCQNFDIVEEILFKIVRKNPGVRIKEIPFTFKKRMFGQTKRSLLSFMATYLFTIIKLRLSS